MKVTERLRALVESAQDLGDRSVCQHALALEKEIVAELQVQSETTRRLGRIHQELLTVRQQMLSGTFDYSELGVLYVDDEETSLRCFARAYGKTFRTLTATNALEALKILKEPKHRLAVTLANHHMPGKSGRWLLNQVRQLEPRLIRILVSSFPSTDDLLAASAAANSGTIYGYIVEPWDPRQMEHLLKRAVEYFILQDALDTATRSLASPHNEH